VRATMRNHWIKVYPEASERIAKEMRGTSKHSAPLR
jgi:hypothetical protein